MYKVCLNTYEVHEVLRSRSSNNWLLIIDHWIRDYFDGGCKKFHFIREYYRLFKMVIQDTGGVILSAVVN